MSSAIETRRDKHFLLNQSRLKQAQRVLGARTETETIELALERVITEAERDEQGQFVHDKFIEAAVKDDLQIEDVFGRLAQK